MFYGSLGTCWTFWAGVAMLTEHIFAAESLDECLLCLSRPWKLHLPKKCAGCTGITRHPNDVSELMAPPQRRRGADDVVLA